MPNLLLINFGFVEGVHDFYIVVMAGRWIMYCNGYWDFKIDNDRMG